MFVTTITQTTVEIRHAAKVSSLLRKGSELTFNNAKQYAYLNMFQENELKVDFILAKNIIELGFVHCWGGNLETGERHYYFISGNNRAD